MRQASARISGFFRFGPSRAGLIAPPGELSDRLCCWKPLAVRLVSLRLMSTINPLRNLALNPFQIIRLWKNAQYMRNVCAIVILLLNAIVKSCFYRMLHSSFRRGCDMIQANLNAERRFHIFTRFQSNELDAAE
jgi:hypothetical protein